MNNFLFWQIKNVFSCYFIHCFYGRPDPVNLMVMVRWTNTLATDRPIDSESIKFNLLNELGDNRIDQIDSHTFDLHLLCVWHLWNEFTFSLVFFSGCNSRTVQTTTIEIVWQVKKFLISFLFLSLGNLNHLKKFFLLI